MDGGIPGDCGISPAEAASMIEQHERWEWENKMEENRLEDERYDLGMDEPPRCPVCHCEYLEHGHHPACREGQLQESIDRMTGRVHGEWFDPADITDVCSAIVALHPGETLR